MKLQLFIVTLCAIYGQIALGMFVSHKNCNGKPVGTYVANPGNCHQYLRCNGLRSTLGECPNGTYFNALVLSCDKSRNACKALETQDNTSPAATTTLTSETVPIEETFTTTTTTESTFDNFEESDEVNTPLILNNKVPYAVFLSNAALAAATYVRPVCNPWLDQAFPHPSNCEYYYYCIRGFLTVRRCSIGHFWDVQRKVCLPRHIARCWNL